MNSLAGKTAWVTGAGSGIGESVVLALASAGARVVLSGRRKSQLRELATRIDAQGGVARVAVLDVTDPDAVKAVAKGIANEEGQLDILVNSAGVNVQNRNWRHLSPADWRHVLRANLDGTYYCCNAVLPMMRARQDGLIINISSWAGRHVNAMTGPAYCASKFGVNALTESINIEEGIHGIRATAVCPGEVATSILDKRPIPVSASDRANMIQPEDCGALVVFLAGLPKRVCINETVISPTWNRSYVAQARAIPD